MKTSPRNGITLAAALTSMTTAFAADGQPPSDEVDATYTTVITPARLKQSLQDAPASVTVITAEQLRRLNIEHVWDALRLVPGMEVTQSTANRVLVNYHGTNIRNPRRMNVLIDGMSVYRPGFSEIYWGQLPVAIEDIERIEVTRGPNSAAYGRQLRGRQPRVEGVQHPPRGRDAVVQLQVAVAVPGQRGHALAHGHALGLQPAGDAARAVGDAAPVSAVQVAFDAAADDLGIAMVPLGMGEQRSHGERPLLHGSHGR